MKKGKEMKTVLIVDDDHGILDELRRLMDKYQPDIRIEQAMNAGEALDYMKSVSMEQRPCAVVLDLMMPYGDGAEELEPQSDPDCLNTGCRILNKFRSDESSQKLPPLWVSVITARSAAPVLTQVRHLLGNNGRLYNKPLDTLIFEHDLVSILGVPSQVPPILLPENYKLPTRKRNGK